MPRKEEKPSFGAKLVEWTMSAGVMVLVGGLVCSFLVVGVWFLHGRLSRNDDPNMAMRDPSTGAATSISDPLEDLKKPLPKKPPPPPPPSSGSVAVKPTEAARGSAAAPKPVEKPKEPPKPAPPAPPPPPPAKVPEGPPTRDASRIDNEGFIRYWIVLAPIPAEKELAGAVEVARDRLEGEHLIRPHPDQRVKIKGREIVWRRHKAPDYFIDFKKVVENDRSDDVLAYAVAYVYSDEEMSDVKLLAGSNDQCRVFLNGKSVLVHDKSRTLEKDQSIVDGLALKKGCNTVILKVANEKGSWQGCLRFMTRQGVPIRHLRVSSTPE